MTDRTYVCEADELQPGERTILSLNGRDVGVLNVEGNYYAISNVCPHQRGPICEGAIKRELDGEYVGPGKRVREFHSDTVTISCPYHGWEYDIETGEHVGDRRLAVPTFNVVVEDDQIFIER